MGKAARLGTGRPITERPGGTSSATRNARRAEMTTTAVVIIIAVIVVAAAVAFYFIRQERSKRLRSRFGPEYEHAVNQFGNQNKAEEALLERQRRIEKINIRPL